MKITGRSGPKTRVHPRPLRPRAQRESFSHRLGLFLLALVSSQIFSCLGIPENVNPVEGFRVERYLGLWYEIARLDHSFERGLTNVSATYALRGDGGIDVTNRGYDPAKRKWREIAGKAYFVKGPEVGRLKVSFFGPIYSSYNVIALDKENYSHAMVCGPNRSYLWILSRSPDLDQSAVGKLLDQAHKSGFATGELIFVPHGDTADKEPATNDGKG